MVFVCSGKLLEAPLTDISCPSYMFCLDAQLLSSVTLALVSPYFHLKAEQTGPSRGAGLGSGLIGVEGKPTGNTFRPPPGFMDDEPTQDAAPSGNPQVRNVLFAQALPLHRYELHQATLPCFSCAKSTWPAECKAPLRAPLEGARDGRRPLRGVATLRRSFCRG